MLNNEDRVGNLLLSDTDKHVSGLNVDKAVSTGSFKLFLFLIPTKAQTINFLQLILNSSLFTSSGNSNCR